MVNTVRRDSTERLRFIQSQLQLHADPNKALPMQQYMKTTMPFYGVHTPARRRIVKQAIKQFPIPTQRDCQSCIRQLWSLPHREEKYIAIDFAELHPRYITSGSLSLYKSMIRTGAWWDFVDPIAIALVGHVLMCERDKTRQTLENWIEDRSLWVRRGALLAHIRHKSHTDWEQLSRHCLTRGGEKDFFIRKAIGWALREYSYTAPERVSGFLRTNRDRLSRLSYREGAKALKKLGHTFA